jgi:A/G-specific adenine glycosylase
MLKKSIPNPSRRSKHYAKQSAFRGSNRELRSKILKYTLMYGKQKPEIIAESLGADLSLVSKNIATMSKEGLI